MEKVLEDKVSTAIDESYRLLGNDPGWRAVEIALQQLALVRDISSGKKTDYGLLSKVNLGLLAAREFEDGEPTYASLLYEIQGLIDKEVLK